MLLDEESRLVDPLVLKPVICEMSRSLTFDPLCSDLDPEAKGSNSAKSGAA